MADADGDGPWQCVATAPGPHTARAAVDVNVGTLQLDARVEIRLDFFATSDCSGGEPEGGDGAVALVSTGWETITTAPLVAPAGTKSARVRLLVGGTYDGNFDSAFFDDGRWCPSRPTPCCVSRRSLRSACWWRGGSDDASGDYRSRKRR